MCLSVSLAVRPSAVTVAYVVTYLKTSYGACEKFLVNNRMTPVRRPYDDDTVSVQVLRAPYGHLTEHLRFHAHCTDRTEVTA